MGKRAKQIKIRRKGGKKNGIFGYNASFSNEARATPTTSHNKFRSKIKLPMVVESTFRSAPACISMSANRVLFNI